MWNGHQVVDSDSHVMEPGSLWEEYIDPQFRATCLRVERDAEDGDRLVIDGVPSRMIRRLGGTAYAEGEPIHDWNSLDNQSYASYRDSCAPASYDGRARVRWLDAHGIDATLLFPSLGLIWPRETPPASPYAVAHLRAYNRWLLDFASADPTRLLPVGQLALSEHAPLGAEVDALAAAGFRHVMLPHGIDRIGTDLDAFWGAAEAHGLVVHVHKVAVPHLLAMEPPTRFSSPLAGTFFNHVNELLPGQLFLAGLLDARVPDRFPRLRFAFHECNVGWLPAWLDRAEESYETLADGDRPRPDRQPTAYFTEQDTFFFSTGLGERLDRLPGELHGRVLLATDFPHPGTPLDPEGAWRERLDRLPAGYGAAVLGDNALRMLKG